MQTPQQQRGRFRTRGHAIRASRPCVSRALDGDVTHPFEQPVPEMPEKIGREMPAVSLKNSSARG
jgi:hypothetical protein